jgi:hypothetical protein
MGDFLVPTLLNDDCPGDYVYPVDEQNYFLDRWIHHFDIASTSIRGTELFSSGRDFLKTIINVCLQKERLYEVIYNDGSDGAHLRPQYRCSLIEHDGQLFCTYYI